MFLFFLMIDSFGCGCGAPHLEDLYKLHSYQFCAALPQFAWMEYILFFSCYQCAAPEKTAWSPLLINLD
jgi:hypothetical protein